MRIWDNSYGNWERTLWKSHIWGSNLRRRTTSIPHGRRKPTWTQSLSLLDTHTRCFGKRSLTEKDTKYCRFDLTKIPLFGIIAVENERGLNRGCVDTLSWIPFQWERSGSYWGNSVNLSGQQLKTLTMVGSKPPLINLKQDRKHIGESSSTNDHIE